MSKDMLELADRLVAAAESFEGQRAWHANHEDGDCEPHDSWQVEMDDASKAAIEAAAALRASAVAEPAGYLLVSGGIKDGKYLPVYAHPAPAAPVPASKLDIQSICGSTKDERCVEVWFGHAVTAADRAAIASLPAPVPASVREAEANFAYLAKCYASRTQEAIEIAAELASVREAAQNLIKVWQGAPVGVSFGAFMERALIKLDAALSSLPAPEAAPTDDLEDLVARFSKALLAKLKLSRANGRSGWECDDWEQHCQEGLLRHLAKGDPRDVAAYCAFMWHHDWATVAPEAAPTREEIISIVEDECFLNHFSPVEKTKSRKTLWRVGHNIRERILALKADPAKASHVTLGSDLDDGQRGRDRE